eukprot:TRINITY_DN7038_c0_g1_i1.p1 TRINITY_DN7038_c0_g1~~TRINITY_DN7038_c0_g1_i1.p1  ORF type:complete len:166 (+),score=28.17 TRINITY_DN7038_c0_g1_i1:194-691(+)
MKGLIKLTLRIILFLVMLYLFYQIIFHLMLRKNKMIMVWANTFMFNCRCVSPRDQMRMIYSNVVMNYYYEENNLYQADPAKKLNYCEKRSKNLHYNFSETLHNFQHSKKKIFIAVMFHQNEQSFPAWFNEFQRLMEFMKPNPPFVSVLESHSTDVTPFWSLVLAE